MDEWFVSISLNDAELFVIVSSGTLLLVEFAGGLTGADCSSLEFFPHPARSTTANNEMIVVVFMAFVFD